MGGPPPLFLSRKCGAGVPESDSSTTYPEGAMTDTAADLLRAIALNPAEDTPRLMYADEIMESDPTRAEFIKAQCLIARVNQIDPRKEPISCEDWDNFNRCRKLQGDLLKRHEAEWRRPKCPTCEDAYGIDQDGNPVLVRCPACNGTGSCGPLSEHKGGSVVGDKAGLDKKPVEWKYDWRHAVTWVRGFPVVKCKLEEVYGFPSEGEVAAEGDRGESVTPWAVECVRIGASFEVTDREPILWQNGLYKWYRSIPLHPEELVVPEYLTKMFTYKEFKTSLAAVAALNAAIHRLVVRAAYPEVQS